MQDDPWARALGIEYLEIRRGYCRLGLALQPHMVNFQGFPHGGVIFSVADIAFGTACNSHGEPAVALSMTISYLTAVAAGSRLLAEARQVKQGRRAGILRGDGEHGRRDPCGAGPWRRPPRDASSL